MGKAGKTVAHYLFTLNTHIVKVHKASWCFMWPIFRGSNLASAKSFKILGINHEAASYGSLGIGLKHLSKKWEEAG